MIRLLGQRSILLPWDELPEFMKNDAVKPYWDVLWHRQLQLKVKRAFDAVLSVVMILLLFVPMLVIAVAVKLDSKGPALYRQTRITQYGREFKIYKFRTMYDSESTVGLNGRQVGSSVTVANDTRITKVGRILRKYRLDEFPQLFNVLSGDMSFVGTRPEIPKYVEKYKSDWNATLLLPPGITSTCSIIFKDEDKLLNSSFDVDKTYLEKILPKKMKINLRSLARFGIMDDIITIINTLVAVIVIKKEY